jgi:RNA polymerase sigma factor (sigma-70 family)
MASLTTGQPQEDRALLGRFIKERDQAAFEMLVRRHGPMVWGVCRRLVRDTHAAEDAFQVTFLVLARKASKLQNREKLASWLYGVAYRASLETRKKLARWQSREKQLVADPPGDGAQQPDEDLKAVLDEEVLRLPAKYRLPVLLCYLQGRTLADAALDLRWPLGTVAGRLSRAKALLRRRLTRRGIAVSIGSLELGLANEVSAGVPASILEATVVTVIRPETMSASVAGLTGKVLRIMFTSKFKFALAIGFGIAMTGTGAGVVAYGWLPGKKLESKTTAVRNETTEPTPPVNNPRRGIQLVSQPTAPDVAMPTFEDQQIENWLARSTEAAPIKKLLRKRYDHAFTEATYRWKEFLAGRGTLEFLYGALNRLLQAEQGIITSPSEQLTLLKQHEKRAKEILAINEERFQMGRITIQDVASSRYYHIEAEIMLERAKQPKKSP